MNFLLTILSWLREFIPPFKIVRADEQGSLLRFGKAGGTLGPGLHWFIPYVWHIRIYNVAYQQIDLQHQTVPTADDVTVTFSANVGYVIEDAQSMDLKVQDFDTTLQRAAMGWLATKVSQKTYDELRTDRTTLQYDLKRSLAALVREWGVDIRDVRLTDLARSPSFRFFDARPTSGAFPVEELPNA